MCTMNMTIIIFHVSIPTFLKFLPTWPPFKFMSFVFITYHVQLLLHICACVWSRPLKNGKSTSGYTLKKTKQNKNDSPSQRRYQLPITFQEERRHGEYLLPIYARILAGLILCRVWTGIYSCCKFMNATAMRCPSSGSYNLYDSLPWCSQNISDNSIGGGGCLRKISHLGPRTQTLIWIITFKVQCCYILQ